MPITLLIHSDVTQNLSSETPRVIYSVVVILQHIQGFSASALLTYLSGSSFVVKAVVLHCRMFSSILDFCLLDTSSILQVIKNQTGL